MGATRTDTQRAHRHSFLRGRPPALASGAPSTHPNDMTETQDVKARRVPQQACRTQLSNLLGDNSESSQDDRVSTSGQTFRTPVAARESTDSSSQNAGLR